MEETLAVESPKEISDVPPVDVDSFRSKLKTIREKRLNLFNDPEIMNFDPNQATVDIVSDFERIKQIELDEEAVAGLEPSDFDAFLEELKKEVSSTEDENIRISNNIDDITKTFHTDLYSLDGDIELLSFSLNLIDSQGSKAGPFSGEARTSTMEVSDHKFEILKLRQQTEICKDNLSVLQDLDAFTKRFESVSQIEDRLSEVKVLEYEGDCIRMSMKTSVPSSDGLLFRHKLDNLVKPHVVEHELLIEVSDDTLEVRKVEIFPKDVDLHDILYTIKSSSDLAIVKHGSQLESLVRQVHHRIIFCTLKKLLLKDAKTSRHSFEYSERDEMITAHMVGGIDAFINVPQSWPLSNSGLKLVSLKSSINNSKSISLALLYKIKEHANSLNIHTRSNLTRFMDAIEETLVREMHSERLS